MKPKRCTACARQWFGSSNSCPDCGAPKRSHQNTPPQTNSNLKNVLWVTAAVMLLIVLLHRT
ncbi:MAG TPA: hypothetical protein VK815_18650 [Candidatus Acidoferrales bacterium]|jgi:hypothetical protein|nr:hypothetical protein [Candidatus Acidoferrales bacterium]